ncbi:MAG TPA: ANTAR domain-containing protein [Solimonas sp.]|nr:ANTAR domain-containing protein [Solimonas sp.]
MKVLLVAEDEARAAALSDRLHEAGCAVFVELGLGTICLPTLIERYRPEMVLLDAASPTSEVLEHLLCASREQPCALVLVSQRADAALARDAVHAGAHAILSGDIAGLDLAPVLAAAHAQFERIEQLRARAEQSAQQLAERKLIERAKGILMKSRGLSEEQAFQAMRSTAMDRKTRLVQIAEQIVSIADLLG